MHMPAAAGACRGLKGDYIRRHQDQSYKHAGACRGLKEDYITAWNRSGGSSAGACRV